METLSRPAPTKPIQSCITVIIKKCAEAADMPPKERAVSALIGHTLMVAADTNLQ